MKTKEDRGEKERRKGWTKKRGPRPLDEVEAGTTRIKGANELRVEEDKRGQREKKKKKKKDYQTAEGGRPYKKVKPQEKEISVTESPTDVN